MSGLSQKLERVGSLVAVAFIHIMAGIGLMTSLGFIKDRFPNGYEWMLGTFLFLGALWYGTSVLISPFREGMNMANPSPKSQSRC